MQYARYAFPGLVLLLPALLIAARQALGAAWAGRLVLALCVLDLAFQPNSNGLLQVSTVRKLASGKGSTALYERYAPERALIAQLKRRDDGDSHVLALDPRTPSVAELGRRGRSTAWYAPRRDAQRLQAETDPSGAGWQRLIEEAQARWLLLRPAQASAALRAGLERVGAQRVTVACDAEPWSVEAGAGR